MIDIEEAVKTPQLIKHLKELLANFEKLKVRSDVKESLIKNNIITLKSLEEFVKREGKEYLERKIGQDPYIAFFEENPAIFAPYFKWWISTLDFTDYSQIFHIGKIPARFITPPNTLSNKKNILLYLHGGGYVGGTIRMPSDLAYRIADASGVRIISLNYGLGPKRGFPEGLQNAVDAFKWLLEKDFEPENIIIFGDSAGGGLTFATLLKLRDLGLPLPKAGIGLSPWVDLTINADSYDFMRNTDAILTKDGLSECVQLYLKNSGEKATNPYISPLLADLEGLPPLLVEVGGSEVFVIEDTHFVEKAKAAGVDATLNVYPDLPHVFQSLDLAIPEVMESIKNIANFIKKQFGL